ncbi:hypothetical protein [Corynebacterium flavescens]|uniref:Uncharacterized protein n=1 Tax=Corynebacterium flavescens TaxID=28028 RepID=A0A1L7CNF6_CORFL|nr:hypothetical protein [Corynebacterium flavescens]APT87373.1 hypothetical protein CFLV_09355 [Corynebacterium flavescens]KAA8720452.1 hypothetical protein F4V60_09120 [Corynebacterium flavescens]GEB97791.1 hypothetical protein CFL01nite_12860 [Corynebacterium flavescens]
MSTPRFINQAGEWLVRIPKADFEQGKEITVPKKTGESKVRIDDWMEEDGDDYLCAFTDLNPKPKKSTPRKASPRRPKAQAGTSATARQLAFLQKLLDQNAIKLATDLYDFDGLRIDVSDKKSLTKKDASFFIDMLNA